MADMVSDRLWDVLIVGAGPAGCSAALYAALGGLTVLLAEKCAVGGGMLSMPEIADWPGEITPVDGIALGERMRKQVLAAGAVIRYGEVTAVTLSGTPSGEPISAILSGIPSPDGTRYHTEIHAKNLILAIGSSAAALVQDKLPLTPCGKIETDHRCRTAVPHVYAIGDCRNTDCRRIVTACADGCRAAMDILGR